MTTHPAPAETDARRDIRSLIRSLLYSAIRVSGERKASPGEGTLIPGVPPPPVPLSAHTAG